MSGRRAKSCSRTDSPATSDGCSSRKRSRSARYAAGAEHRAAVVAVAHVHRTEQHLEVGDAAREGVELLGACTCTARSPRAGCGCSSPRYSHEAVQRLAVLELGGAVDGERGPLVDAGGAEPGDRPLLAHASATWNALWMPSSSRVRPSVGVGRDALDPLQDLELAAHVVARASGCWPRRRRRCSVGAQVERRVGRRRTPAISATWVELRLAPLRPACGDERDRGEQPLGLGAERGGVVGDLLAGGRRRRCPPAPRRRCRRAAAPSRRGRAWRGRAGRSARASAGSAMIAFRRVATGAKFFVISPTLTVGLEVVDRGRSAEVGRPAAGVGEEVGAEASCG